MDNKDKTFDYCYICEEEEGTEVIMVGKEKFKVCKNCEGYARGRGHGG